MEVVFKIYWIISTTKPPTAHTILGKIFQQKKFFRGEVDDSIH